MPLPLKRVKSRVQRAFSTTVGLNPAGCPSAGPPEPRVLPQRLLLSSSHSPALPADLLRVASRRLQIMSLLGAGLWLVGPLLQHLTTDSTSPTGARWTEFLPLDGLALGSLFASLALWGYLRRQDREPSLVITLALGYLVMAALTISFMTHWGLSPAEQVAVRPTLTWVGPVVLMVAAIVPVPPALMLLAGLVAALMGPVAMLLLSALGRGGPVTLPRLAVMHLPDLLLVGVAVIVSQVVTRLGRQVSHAREFGSYRLGPLLGEGGMGQVYRAKHRLLARPAAIKLIRPATLTGDRPGVARRTVARFHREAQAAAQLRSPHTVELYDFGVADDGTLYMVMELLDGLSLEDLVERYGPMPVSRVVHTLRQVCDSLDEAHAAGLVHRDIKPGNIHLGRVGQRYDVAKVLDFGLVKPLNDAWTGQSLETAVGFAVGTPGYMAPEQVDGQGVDRRADIYAFGCVAYFLLTGQLVFDAVTPVRMLLRHLEDPPVPPSQRTGEPLPAGLDDLILACLAKNPADRPATAGVLAGALDGLAVQPWTQEQAATWWQSRGRPTASSRQREPVLTSSMDHA